jgi:hypothetical protein
MGRWDQFAGQYFDCFDVARHTRGPQEIELTLVAPIQRSVLLTRAGRGSSSYPCQAYFTSSAQS